VATERDHHSRSIVRGMLGLDNASRDGSVIFSKIRVFLILKRTERDAIINVHKCSCKVAAILDRFWLKVEFLGWIFQKSSNIKFYENSYSGIRDVLRGQTDGLTGRHEEATSRISLIVRLIYN
jgi:hypothetical protein